MDTVTDKPKHTPSEKHALDEVLKSLKDLIQNELLDAEPKVPPPKIHHGKVGRPRKIVLPPAPKMPKPAVQTFDLDSVMANLRTLVTQELVPEDSPQQNIPAKPAQADATAPTPPPTPEESPEYLDVQAESHKEPSPLNLETELVDSHKTARELKPKRSHSKKAAVPPEGFQQAFEFPTAESVETERAVPASTAAEAPAVESTENLDIDLAVEAPAQDINANSSVFSDSVEIVLESPAATADAVLTATEETVVLEAQTPLPEADPEHLKTQEIIQHTHAALHALERNDPPTQRDEPPALAVAELPSHVSPAADADEPDIDLNDLPVLDDVVMHPPDQEFEMPSVSPSVELPHPTPEQLHLLAVRTAARLNIELRKIGKPLLEPKAILRLQSILAEELKAKEKP
jgi:hypothetical protein